MKYSFAHPLREPGSRSVGEGLWTDESDKCKSMSALHFSHCFASDASDEVSWQVLSP